MKPQIADRVYYGLDSFGKRKESWRVESFLKRVECIFEPQIKPTDVVDRIVHDIIALELVNEKLSREEQGLPCSRRFQYQWCKRDEATHVSLRGVCGCIAPIDQVEIVGPCWDEEKVNEEIKRYETFFLLGKCTDWYWE